MFSQINSNYIYNIYGIKILKCSVKLKECNISVGSIPDQSYLVDSVDVSKA